MNRLFAPGCALMIYKPHLAARLHDILREHFGHIDMLLTCCRHVPPLTSGSEVINICPGCDRRYRENYPDASTISLWEVIAEHSFFAFPDYEGREMTIIDACPTRDQPRVHNAVRRLVRRMNITLVEPLHTRTKSTCCGDSLWGNVPTECVVRQMKKKASTMPVEDVVVYCVSCSKAMFVGGRRPRYLIDLLFDEDTVPQTYEPDLWHAELDEYIGSHT
ncbi:MAG: (Fe-S)-binding protein [Phycisphaerae bacterium]|nr:(Fe-S)-binding protein [Phycisphaerae bacterium]